MTHIISQYWQKLIICDQKVRKYWLIFFFFFKVIACSELWDVGENIQMKLFWSNVWATLDTDLSLYVFIFYVQHYFSGIARWYINWKWNMYSAYEALAQIENRPFLLNTFEKVANTTADVPFEQRKYQLLCLTEKGVLRLKDWL